MKTKEELKRGMSKPQKDQSWVGRHDTERINPIVRRKTPVKQGGRPTRAK
jgi:hypothetical protein